MADETTTDRLAEIEGQAADYLPPEGWRWLQIGEVIRTGDRWVRLVDGQVFDAYPNGQCVRHRRFIRRIEPQPEPEGSCPQLHPWLRTPPEQQADRIITPDDVAAEALAGVWDQAKAEQEIAELQAQVKFLKNRELTLGTRLQEEKAVTAKRLQQVEELRDEVSYVQGLLGESRKAMNSAARDKADLQHRLDTVAAEWALQAETIRGLQTQLEAVKAEVVQERLERNQWQNHAQRTETQLVEKVSECRNLRIELDALQQAPQAEPVAPQAVSERWEESYNKGAAQAVETIAEWTEPFRTCGSQSLALAVLQNLPHIMRSLTGLADED